MVDQEHVHPAGTSEISDLCGNISNFRLNVSLWVDVDRASFWEKISEIHKYLSHHNSHEFCVITFLEYAI